VSDEPSRMSDLPPGPPGAPVGESALEGAAELGFASGAPADDDARGRVEAAAGGGDTGDAGQRNESAGTAPESSEQVDRSVSSHDAGEQVEATQPGETSPSAAASTESEPGGSEQGLASASESNSAVQSDAAAAADAESESEAPADTEEEDELDEEDIEAEDEDEDEVEDEAEDVEPIELIDESAPSDQAERNWYILKVQVNREESIRDAMLRRVKLAGLEQYFGDVVVPTEDVVEFTKTGKKRVAKKKLFPGYIVVDMALNDDTWFLVRETPGIGDFTGSAGKPTPMLPHEVSRIIRQPEDEGAEGPKKMSIPFKPGNRVRVKEGYFQNFEGDVETIDEANGRVTVMINIFGRSTPVELEHWQVEAL